MILNYCMPVYSLGTKNYKNTMIIIFGPFRQKKPLEIKGLLSRLAQILAVRFPLC